MPSKPPPKTSTTRLPKSVLQELGLDDAAGQSSSSKRNKNRNQKPLGRKERRRHGREVKRAQRQGRRVRNLPPPLREEKVKVKETEKRQKIQPTESIPQKAIPVEKGENQEKLEFRKPAPGERKQEERREGRPLRSILKKPKPVEDPQPTPPVRKAVRDLLEKDDKEIEYLEKKLKIKGRKLPKAFEEDGLDFLMEGLDGDFSGGERKRRRTEAAAVAMSDGGETGDDEVDDEQMDDSDGGWDDELGEEGDTDDGQDIGDEESSGGDEGESMRAPADTKESEAPIDTRLSKAPQASKYIPPSLRKSQAPEPENLIILRRRCHGILNRLSEANLTSILSEIEGLYSTNPRGDVTSSLSNLLIAIVGNPSVLMDTFMILHAGFVAGVYKLIGTDFGAHVVQAVIEDFDEQYEKANRANDPATAGKECANLVSFVSELYNLQVIGPVLVFDLLRIFLGEITELNTELLLKLARNCGFQLRHDDPAALKDIVLMMQPAIAKIGYPNLNTRTKFMIETLTNLKNNRLKTATANSAVVSEATIRMKRLLGALNTHHIRASEPLRVSLADIRDTETKGKWWLVGASWAGNQASDAAASGATGPTKPPGGGGEDFDFGSPANLLQLARQQRMNTEVRQAIFVAVMSAEDFTDAYNRILKLRLKRKQEPEIPRVLIHCCGSEAPYNPYYTLVARKLCVRNSLRTAFAFSLWSVFRQMGEGDSGREEADVFDEGEEGEGLDMRKILHLARMYGTLIAEGALGLDVLKILDMAYLQTKTKTFLELMFITAILQTLGQDAANEEALNRVFLKIRENAALVRGTLYFLRKHVRGTDVMGSNAEAAIVARGVRKSCSLLETFIARDTLGE